MAADVRLASLTPLPRQAFLLVALEGFAEEDAARILDVDVARLRSLVEESGRELAAEIATDVLIIEDETFIAMDLESLVESLGHRVLGVARTQTEALAIARKKTPGLILADIQLADGSSGLDAVNELLRTFEVPVIFITAYPERFLTGERPEPAFLIAKPFQPAMVSAIASQALFFARNAKRRKKRGRALKPARIAEARRRASNPARTADAAHRRRPRPRASPAAAARPRASACAAPRCRTATLVAELRDLAPTSRARPRMRSARSLTAVATTSPTPSTARGASARGAGGAAAQAREPLSRIHATAVRDRMRSIPGDCQAICLPLAAA